MADKKTIRVDEGVFEAAKAQKESNGQTWDEYLVDENRSGPDADDVARKVVERLEGSKPLAEMEFDDWFEPNYAKTIADHIEAEMMISDDYAKEVSRQVTNDLVNKLPKTNAVSLDATERQKMAQEVAEELR